MSIYAPRGAPCLLGPWQHPWYSRYYISKSVSAQYLVADWLVLQSWFVQDTFQLPAVKV